MQGQCRIVHRGVFLLFCLLSMRLSVSELPIIANEALLPLYQAYLEGLSGGISSSALSDNDAGWRMWVVPFGVSDPLAWPADRPIPSNKITVHLGARQGPVRADLQVTISLLRTSPIGEVPQKLGDKCVGNLCLSQFARTKVQIAPSYDLNIGPGAAGAYLLELYGHNVTSSSPSSDGADDDTLLAFKTFQIRPQRPEERAARQFSCDPLPAVTAESTWEAPPVNIPVHLCKRYTMNGTIGVGRDYYDDRR
jgi:hypothetical protein